MYLYQFQRLCAQAQLLLTRREGTYLTCRWEASTTIHLYHVANPAHGFFVEVSLDEHQHCFAVRSSFHDVLLLEQYVAAVPLPRLLAY